MISIEERIDICVKLRKETSEAIAKVLREHPELSETEFREYLSAELFAGESVHKEGW